MRKGPEVVEQYLEKYKAKYDVLEEEQQAVEVEAPVAPTS